MNKFRYRILSKLAQATSVLPPEKDVPPSLYANLNTGYNSITVPSLIELTDTLNTAMHYASQGKDNFDKIIGNNLEISNTPDRKNISAIAKKIFTTFLNSKNAFQNKISATDINNWADAIISLPEYNALSQVNPKSALALKIPNLKSEIQKIITKIKTQNPTH